MRNGYITTRQARLLVRMGVRDYKPVTLARKILGYTLVGYGLVTFVLPSGSQVALIIGCGIIGIPFKVVWGKIKLCALRVWFICCVIASKRRLKYELNRIKARW